MVFLGGWVFLMSEVPLQSTPKPATQVHKKGGGMAKALSQGMHDAILQV